MIRILREFLQFSGSNLDQGFANGTAEGEADEAQHDDALGEVLRLGLLHGISGETLLTII